MKLGEAFRKPSRNSAAVVGEMPFISITLSFDEDAVDEEFAALWTEWPTALDPEGVGEDDGPGATAIVSLDPVAAPPVGEMDGGVDEDTEEERVDPEELEEEPEDVVTKSALKGSILLTLSLRILCSDCVPGKMKAPQMFVEGLFR